MSLKNKVIESALRWRLDRKKGKLNCLLINDVIIQIKKIFSLNLFALLMNNYKYKNYI